LDLIEHTAKINVEMTKSIHNADQRLLLFVEFKGREVMSAGLLGELKGQRTNGEVV